MAFWLDLDNWVLSQYESDPTLASQCQTFSAALIQNPTHWHTEPELWPLPAIIVFSSRAFSEVDAQKRSMGGGPEKIALRKTYTYTILGAVRGNLSSATVLAKDLYQNMEQVMVTHRYQLSSFSPDTNTNEKATQVTPGDSRIVIYKNPDDFFGVAILTFQIDSRLP